MKFAVSTVCLLALVSVVASKPSSPECRYYCQKPGSLTYDCCDGISPGRCPPPRKVCPQFASFGPPNVCSSDRECSGGQKCCQDTCLKHRTCKPVVQ